MRLLMTLLLLMFQNAPSSPPQVPADVLSQFDFLVGSWDFTYIVKNPDGRLATNAKGRWTAHKTADGRAIEDTWVLLDDAGKPRSAGLLTVRAYNRTAGQWQYRTLNLTAGTWQDGSGEQVDHEMHLIQSPPHEKPDGNWLRIRYYNIRPDSFSWIADVGDGKTWVPELIQIEATRAK